MPLRVRLTTEPDGSICVESLYDARFVELLKQDIPRGSRAWDGDRKRWIVSTLYVEELLSICQHCTATILDERAKDARDTVIPCPPMPEDLREAFDTLTLAYGAPLELAEVAFRFYSKYYHPDKGGDTDLFRRCNDAMGTIRRYLKPMPTEDDIDPLPF